MAAPRRLRLSATRFACVTVCVVAIAASCPRSTQVAAASATPPHVMVIVEENQEYGQVIGSGSAPYLNSLAGSYANATAWFAVEHNSINDYLELVSGSNQGIGGANQGPFAGPTVVDELAAAGTGWRAYMEDAPSSCYTGGDTAGYMRIHNPFVYFSSILGSPSQCGSVVPFAGHFVNDLNGGTAPPFMFVVPNSCDDMHGGTPSFTCAGSDPVAQGDQWLSTYLPTVLASGWYRSGGVVVITWDEGTSTSGLNGGSGGHIPTVVVAAGANGPFTAAGDHYGTLRAIEEAYGVGLLGASSDAANGDLSGAIPSRSDVGLRYVTQVYQDLLGRAPDQPGLVYWSGLIDGGQPRYPIAVSLTSSTEYVGDRVQALYSRYLHRPADGTTSTGGEGFWVGYIARGATYEQLAESLIASDEYFDTRAGADITRYVQVLYQDILGRGPDPGGLAYWVAQLDAGRPRFVVSASILVSTEGYQDLVASVYQTFLRQQPDAGGLAYWTAQLLAGLRDETFIASIIGSDQYLQLALAG